MVATVHTNMSAVEGDGNAASLSAYGNARHHRAADITGNGGVDGADQLALLGSWGSYGVGDLNRDGVVDGGDLLIMQANWGSALPAGQLSAGASGTDNIIGYAGYIFNAEIPGAGLYTVRHRHYAPDLGRWLSRDPLGYVDGMSLYEYVRGRPCHASDPTGLLTQQECNNAVQWCMANDSRLTSLSMMIRRCTRDPKQQGRGARLPTVLCARCQGRRSRGQYRNEVVRICVTGQPSLPGFNDPRFRYASVCDTLVHEHVHAHQDMCNAVPDHDVPPGVRESCARHICMEIQAYYCDGRSEVWLGGADGHSSFIESVRRSTLGSARPSRFCTEDDLAQFDHIFEALFAACGPVAGCPGVKCPFDL